MQDNPTDHDPANCSLYREMGDVRDGVEGRFNPPDGRVVRNDGMDICPSAEFTPAPPGVSSYNVHVHVQHAYVHTCIHVSMYNMYMYVCCS